MVGIWDRVTQRSVCRAQHRLGQPTQFCRDRADARAGFPAAPMADVGGPLRQIPARCLGQRPGVGAAVFDYDGGLVVRRPIVRGAFGVDAKKRRIVVRLASSTLLWMGRVRLHCRSPTTSPRSGLWPGRFLEQSPDSDGFVVFNTCTPGTIILLVPEGLL